MDPGLRCETYLGGQNERSQEHTFACPLLRPDGKVGHCAVDVDERYEHDGGLDLGAREHVGHELGELRVAVDALGV